MSDAPRLGYVVRFVDSLGLSLDFYARVVGLRCTKRSEHWAQFDCGSVRFGLYERRAMAGALGIDAESLGRPPGGVELAFEVDDVDAAHDDAVDRGARSLAPPGDRPWGERTAYLLDPDGGIVELFRPRGASPAER